MQALHKNNLHERFAHEPGLFLALGGGAARGLAHLGVLKVLEEEKIPIAGICGTSMGAIIGACYALHPEIDEVIKDFRNHVNDSHFVHVRFAYLRKTKKDAANKGRGVFRKRLSEGLMLGRSYITGAVISYEEYRNEIGSLVPDRSFRNTQIPFFATGLDLTNQREIVFEEGNLRSAVMASSAIPGVFPAVSSGGVVYVDGGWMNRIPVNPLLVFGAQNILAVDVSDDPPTDANPKRGYSMMNEATRAAMIRLAQIQCERASEIWQPPIQGMHWADFSAIDQAIETGETYARERIDKIKALLDNYKQPKPLNFWQRTLLRMARVPEPKRDEHPCNFELRPIWDIRPAEKD